MWRSRKEKERKRRDEGKMKRGGMGKVGGGDEGFSFTMRVMHLEGKAPFRYEIWWPGCNPGYRLVSIIYYNSFPKLFKTLNRFSHVVRYYNGCCHTVGDLVSWQQRSFLPL